MAFAGLVKPPIVKKVEMIIGFSSKKTSGYNCNFNNLRRESLSEKTG